jgi:hypothetical protein
MDSLLLDMSRMQPERANTCSSKQSAQLRNDSKLGGRALEARLSSPKDVSTLTEHDSEVNKVSNPNSVLFDCSPIRSEHSKTVELLFKPLPVPQGGPWCVCSLKAMTALKKGVPVPCAELPWKCPFASEIAGTPTT